MSALFDKSIDCNDTIDGEISIPLSQFGLTGVYATIDKFEVEAYANSKDK